MNLVGWSQSGNCAVSAPKLPPETVERLRAVVQDWGREVTGAQKRLQDEIRAAATELSQIEDLLVERFPQRDGSKSLDDLEALKQENENLRAALAERGARIRELLNQIATQNEPI